MRMYWLYSTIVLFLFLFGFMFGWALPFLFSSEDTLLVLLGNFIMLIIMPLVLLLSIKIVCKQYTLINKGKK